MKRSTLIFTLVLAGAAYSIAAKAQEKEQSKIITLNYESVFKDYKPHKDVPLRDWKTSNEAVRQAGGWRQYLKESQAPESSLNTNKQTPANHNQHGQPTESKNP